jgi:imidazolonepropionase-like amidohydrolase
LGVCKEGAIADLIILDKNPLEDIEILDLSDQYLVGVIKEGKVLSCKLKGWECEIQ